MVVGIGVIAGTECLIMANDPSVLGGALTLYSAKKWMRALEIARDNQIPYVSFVESAGADLRVGRGGGGRMQTGHFAESGRFFYDLIELSKMRVPTVWSSLARPPPVAPTSRDSATTTSSSRISRRSSSPVHRW